MEIQRRIKDWSGRLLGLATLLFVALIPGIASAQDLVSVSFDPVVVQTGTSTKCTIHLTGPAGPSGVTIQIATAHPFVQIPTSQVVPAGSKDFTFDVPIGSVTSNKAATVNFSLGTRMAKASVQVLAALGVSSLKIAPGSVSGGGTATGTVRLTNPATGAGFTVNLTSSEAFVSVPATIVVPAGSQNATFTLTTQQVPANKSATITATSPGGQTLKSDVKVQHLGLAKVTISAATVVGGNQLTGTIKLTDPAPSDGFLVTLTSSETFATVPATVTIPAGAQTATFTITTTLPSAEAKDVTITATAQGASMKSGIKVTKK